MISTVVNTIIRTYKKKNFSEFCFKLVSVSLKFFMQKLLHFIVGMNFMLSQFLQEVIDAKNATLPQN